MNLLAITALLLAPSQQPQFLGAREVLNRMTAPVAGSALRDPAVLFAEDTEAFGNRVVDLPPDQAASEWLSLVLRSFALRRERNAVFMQFDQTHLIQALPGPEAWPLIAQKIDQVAGFNANQKKGLHLLMEVLQGHDAEAKKLLQNLPPDSNQIALDLAIRTRDADAIENALKHQEPQVLMTSNRVRTGPSFPVPNIVPILGEPRAEALLAYLLEHVEGELTFSNEYPPDLGDASTENLARKWAIQHVDKLAHAQWTLAASLDAGELFPAMRQRFPKDELGVATGSYFRLPSFHGAATYYFVRLFLSGDLARAKAFALANSNHLSFGYSGLTDGPLSKVVEAGKLDALFEFLGNLAKSNPDSALVYAYTSLALDSNHKERMASVLKVVAEKATQTAKRRYAQMSLDAKQSQPGQLDQYLAAKGAGPLPPLPETSSGWLNAKLLLILGRDLHRPDLTKQGLEFAERDPDFDDGLFDLLKASGKGPWIEQALIQAARASVNGESSSYPPAGQLAGLPLVDLYYRLGRYEDVLTFLEKFATWDATDLRRIIRAEPGNFRPYEIVAKSLEKVGRHEEASRVALYGLWQNPGDDGAYALFLELQPNAAEATFRKLADAFPLTCRPNLWIAEILLRRSELVSAETYAKKAVDQDPDDIEAFGRPTRFKVFAVLSEIYRKTGRTDDAKLLDRYPQANGLTAQASEYDEVGLNQTAIDLYRQELAVLPNDFEVRLALVKTEIKMGRPSDADKDLKEAILNIPNRSAATLGYRYGVGFPQEFISNPVLSEALAEGVRRSPGNAALSANLGLVHQLTHQTSAAVGSYMRSVDLDPDCVDAWQGIASLREIAPPQYVENADLNLVRLNPRSLWPDGRSSLSYAKQWIEGAKAFRLRTVIPPSVFPLNASRDQLDRTVNPDFVRERQRKLWPDGFGPPAGMMGKDQVLTEIWSLITRPAAE